MFGSAVTIEKLSRQLEQQKFLSELMECRTMDDVQDLIEKYKAICEKHGR